jgi:uncharacterized membrane protein YagU involved in acid resistance
VVLGGLTAGVLDIVDAFVTAALAGRTPARVLQTIASGVLGPRAYQSGAASAALGLALHFAIALSAAMVYFLASRRLPWLVRHPVWSGLAFGLLVWAFMYHVVLPITFHRAYTLPAWPQLANQLGIHMLGVGLPIALLASRSARSH